MKKAEMEAHRANYHTVVQHARHEISKSQFAKAIALALESFLWIDGMVQFSKRYEESPIVSLEAFDIIFKYAPLLFDGQSLDTLKSLLQSLPRVDRRTQVDEWSQLSRSREVMRDARRLWNFVEKHGEIPQSSLQAHLGGIQEHWRCLAELWEEMGILSSRVEAGSYLLFFSTRMSDNASAKCPECGLIVRRPKFGLLCASNCPTCDKSVSFVLLA